MNTGPRHTYRASRREAAFGLLCVTALLLGGVFLIHGAGTSHYSAEAQESSGWTMAAIAILLLPFAGLWVALPARLTFDAAGFRIRQPWERSRFYPWSEIDHVTTLHNGKDAWVVWSYRDERSDGMLRGAWPKESLDAIADDLEQARLAADQARP